MLSNRARGTPGTEGTSRAHMSRRAGARGDRCVPCVPSVPSLFSYSYFNRLDWNKAGYGLGTVDFGAGR